jgi:hypothetical protein
VAVDLRFYDLNGQEISLDKATGGHDFGIVRKNSQYIVPVIIKNIGTTDAVALSVKGSPLHSPSEISAEEYANEVMAGNWKTFSFLPDRGYTSLLSLPNIPANSTMIGQKELIEEFDNPASSAWVNDTLTGHTFSWTGTSLLVKPASGVITCFARADAQGWGNNEDIDFTVEFSMPLTTTAGSAFQMFCLRQNSMGDEKGYLINIKRIYVATSGTSTIQFEIRKGAGIKANGSTDYATILYTSQSISWNDFQPIRIKLKNDSSGQPEIKIWVNNILDTDTPVQWGTTNPTSSYVDTVKSYPYSGLITAIFGSSGNNLTNNQFEIRRATLLTKDAEGKVYIKTVVGDGAEDSVVYHSSMELSYDTAI